MRELHANVRIVFNGNRLVPTSNIVLALTVVVSLSACGGGKNQGKSTVSKTATTNAKVEPAASPPPTEAQSASGKVPVARVGNIPITAAEVVHAITTKTSKVASYEPRSRAECSSVRAPNEVTLPKGQPRLTVAQIQKLCERQHEQKRRAESLESLISYQWVVGEASEDGFRVSNQEVERQYQAEKKAQFPNEAKFQQYLNSTGYTVADLLLGIRLNAVSEKIRGLIQNGVGSVTQARVAAYYSSHKHLFVVPERRDVAAIRTWTRPAAEKAKREVQSGVSFAKVAHRVSIERPSAERRGVTFGIVRGQQEKGYDQAIFAAKPHVLLGPLNLRKRYYVFRVERIIPARRQSFAEVEAAIMQKLPGELQQQALAAFIKAWRKKWTARTSCRPGYVVPKCRQYKSRHGMPPEDPYSLS